MKITISGSFITKEYFNNQKKQTLKDFFYQYGEQFDWDLALLAEKAAEHFCFSNDFSLDFDDEYEYLTDEMKENIADKYFYNLYEYELDAIYSIMSGFEIPKSKISTMEIE